MPPPIPFRAKWSVCVLLLLATTLNYLDRQTVSILAPRMQAELKLDNADLGWLFSVFYYSYTCAQFAVGLLLDRGNLRWLYGGAVVGWSLACALTGFARSFAALLGFRLLLGIMESANWPGALRIIARTLPPAERSMGNGLFTSGTSIGALIAPSLMLGISAAFGWRWAFVAVGALGLLWFAAWMGLTRSATLAPVWQAPAKTGGTSAGWTAYREILQDPQFWRVFGVSILVNPCLYFFLNWLPTYFVQQRGVAPGAQMGSVLTGIYLGLDLGYLLGGGAVLALVRRGYTLRSARRGVFLTASLLLLAAAIVPEVKTLNTAVALLVLANFATGTWISLYLTLAQEVNPAHVATTAGLLGGSGSFAGALAMWAVGKITQQTGSFALPLQAVALVALLAALAAWVASQRAPTQASGAAAS